MEEGRIIFNCLACGVRLSIEKELASVSGPCPECREQIQAPEVSDLNPMDSKPPPQAPPAPRSEPDSEPAATQGPANPEPLRSAKLSAADGLLPAMPPPEKSIFPKLILSPSEIEQRDFAQLSDCEAEPQPAREPSGFHDDEAASAKSSPETASGEDEQEREAVAPALWYRQVWLWGVAAVLMVTAWVVVQSLSEVGAPPRSASTERVDCEDAKTPVLVKLPKLSGTDSEPGKLVVIKLPDQRDKPEIEPESKPQPDVKPQAEKTDFSQLADADYMGHSPIELLSAFLRAQSLLERWPMIISQSKPESLLDTPLDGLMPEPKQVELEYQDPNSEAGYTDHVFAVGFVDGGGDQPLHRMVVRQRPGRAPKVLADPLLDLWGGKLRDFASQVREGDAEFDAVVTVLARCSDEGVPYRKRKMTLKLMERDHDGEIARAFFSRDGAVAKLLDDGSFRLGYGKSVSCRVKLRWNCKEDPKKPWLEATEITRFGWAVGS